MSITLITPKLKDQLLADLLALGSMNVGCNIRESAKEFNVNSDIVAAIYDQFENIGLIKQSKCLGGRINFQIMAEAHDLFNRGGFTAQEEILKANIQKLSDELDLLAKQLSPDLLEKATTISTISANILTAIGLFKT